MKRAAMICLIALIAACAGENKSEPLTWHPLEKTADLDPAPNVLEVEIVARQAEIEILPGVKSAAWTYNGMFPGPLLEAKVGDTLKVHFKNELPQATTIHWHGIRLPATMDGAMVMMDPVQPGGTFEYEFVLRDAGYYWYHPHMYTDEAMERGLYGAIVVREAVEPKVDVDFRSVGQNGLALPHLLVARDDFLLSRHGILDLFALPLGLRPGEAQLGGDLRLGGAPQRRDLA